MRELSTKQRRFIDAFNGNAAEAARAAGYSEKNADKIGAQLLKNPRVVSAIRERENGRSAAAIATREERQRLFTNVMRDEGQTTRDRLRACELLGKSEGDFVERQEITGADGRPLVPGEPLEITVKFVEAITDEQGRIINPDTDPAKYAAAWLRDFFRDHGAPGELEKVCAALEHVNAARLPAGDASPMPRV